MEIKVKKSILLNFLNLINENKSSRGDTVFNNTTGFFGNFGAVKSLDNPIKPKPQMALQMSTAEPPVDDPEYMPATVQELCLAACRISKEVPTKKIEFFYRKLHKLLDAALNDDDKKLFHLQEAIDYDMIENPAHKKQIKGLIDQAVAMASRSTSDDNYMTTDQAAYFAMRNRTVTRYDITLQDVIDEIEMHNTDAIADKEADVFVEPPETIQDLSPPTQNNATIKKTKPKTKSKAKKVKKFLTQAPTEEIIDKRAEDEMMDMMASAYSEYVEMDEYAKTWDWKNYKDDAPYLKLLFDIIKILHQLSYRVLQASYINKYGGYVYDPEADQPGGKKGGFVLEKSGPTSRPEAQAMMRRIHSDFGLTYETMMRQKNILKMDHEFLVNVIERAMIGIFQRVPSLYNDFIQSTAKQFADRIDQGADPELIQSEAFSFIANVLAHKYRGESEILDRDLINVAIAGIFKRCLLDLPIELGLSPSVTLSLNSLTKKKSQKTDVTRGFNLAGAMKRFEKLRKDKSIANSIKKLMPALVLNKITDTLTAKVTKKGSTYHFEDKSNGLGIEIKGSDLKKKIKEYVTQMLKGKKPSFAGDDEVADPEDMSAEPYDESAEEKEAKSRLSKDDYEVRKMVKEMEKMVASGDWMHIAPLFGFSGAPGVRSWYLRYPQRKFMIMTAARSDQAPSGAKRYLKVFRDMRENLGNSLITLNKKTPGVLDLMIDEIASKKSIATSDQQMIELLEEMRNDIEELIMLYENYDSYEALEDENPQELKRLSNTPGGSLLRFGIGAVFDKIIKDMDSEWHSEMKAYLETKTGLKEKTASDLAYYFTGLKNKPSKGDFNEDKEKLSSSAQAFVNAGIQAEEFFSALRYSQGWFFSTLDRELKKGVAGDNYYNMVKELTGQPLYIRDKKNPKIFKLDKKVYKIFKKLIEGKNGAIAAYLDNLAIEQFQQKTLKKVKDIKSKKPDLFQ